MSSKPVFENARLADLLTRTAEFKVKGWRFVQCCATDTGNDTFELLYTFANDDTGELTSLVIPIAASDEVPSVGDMYPASFMFENEMHDLFGITVAGIVLDYHGGFYHLHIPTPMAKSSERHEAKKAEAAKEEEA